MAGSGCAEPRPLTAQGLTRRVMAREPLQGCEGQGDTAVLSATRATDSSRSKEPNYGQ